MALAAMWLTAWEYDRFKPLVFRDRTDRPAGSLLQFVYLPLLFAAGGGVVGAIWWLMRLGNFSNYLYIGGVLSAGGLIFGTIVALHYRTMPVGRLKERREAM